MDKEKLINICRMTLCTEEDPMQSCFMSVEWDKSIFDFYREAYGDSFIRLVKQLEERVLSANYAFTESLSRLNELNSSEERRPS